MKTCRRCGETKSLDAFSKCSKNSDGINNYCKRCKESMRSPNKITKEQAFENKVKKNYGLTVLQVELLFKKANYCCQICGGTKELCIDHDHSTYQIRGILCCDCNRGLGMMKDSIDILIKAIEYLKQAPKDHSILLLLNR
jgi:hypothetical protein